MSTTVVASRHGASLVLLPAAGSALDEAAVRQVLERHGLRLLAGTDLSRAHEFIAAEGLAPADAAALADDLRAVGLSARVVNRTALTGSRRVGNAIAAQMIIGMSGLLSIAAATQIAQGSETEGLAVALPLLGGVAIILLAIFNAITLNRHGGYGLRVAGALAAPTPLGALTDQLSALEKQLPEHLAAPLMARARQLVEHARTDPDGEAAAELAAMLEELRQDVDQRAAQDARELREEVARARRAILETQKR